MPAAVLKRLAKKAKVSMAKAERKWNKAKSIVKDEYGIGEGDKNFYALTTAITKKLLRLGEDVEPIRFKKFLGEASHYGSLVDKDKYDDLDKADQALYKYTADGFTSLDQYMDKLTKKYPYEGGTLYRGLHFEDQEQHDEFLKSIDDGIIDTSGPTSWAKNQETAEDFAHSKKTYFPTFDVMHSHQKMKDEGEWMSGYGGVVLKTTVKKVGVDVQQSDFGKESEVILPTGYYEVSVVKKMEPHKRKYGDEESVLSLIDDFKNAEEKTKDLDSKYEYVVKSWLPKLSEKEADALLQYSMRKFLSHPKEFLRDKYSSFELDQTLSRDDSHYLRLHVSVPVDERVYDKASPKMQAQVDRQVKQIAIGLKGKIDQLMKSDKLDKLDEFNIYGVDDLRHFVPDEADDAVKELRKMLGKRYHQLNDRETTRQLTDADAVKNHGKKIRNVVQAISNL